MQSVKDPIMDSLLQIRLTVSCSDLVKREATSNVNPVCILWAKNKGRWEELKRTEELKDSLNPRWATDFVLDYKFEERQLLKFEVLDKVDPLGQMECSLGELVANQISGFSKDLVNGDKSPAGKIFVQAEELVAQGAKDIVELVFEGQNLPDHPHGKTDSFMEISKVNEDGGFSMVHRTETVDNDLNPVWKPITIEVSKLCNCDYNRQLKFDVFDEDFGEKNDFIGSFLTTLQTLMAGPGPLNTYEVINFKDRQKPKYTNSGKVLLKGIKVTTQPTFLDFLSRGLQLNFTVAVDFTASNGLPTNPLSLHYSSKDEEGCNEYETVVRSIGEILQDYDANKLCEALGFGAIVPPSIEVSHQFNLKNLKELDIDGNRETCHGVDGVIDAYKKSLNVVELHGPTHFAPVIEHMARQAERYNSEPTVYSILLIITDGIITDMEATKEAIIKASGLPLSIIIVGVGDEDFSQMEQLDVDHLQIGTNVAKRDIVQFIEMNPEEEDHEVVGVRNKEGLAKEVLKEVPKQVTKYTVLEV